MGEAEFNGMKPLAFQAKFFRLRRIRPVKNISDARMPNSRHVNTNLMGTPSLQVDFEQRDIASRHTVLLNVRESFTDSMWEPQVR